MGLERTDGVEHGGQGMGVMFDGRVLALEPAGAAIARHVPGDDAEILRQRAELERPGLRRAAKSVQQHQRRFVGFGVADRYGGATEIDGFQFG